MAKARWIWYPGDFALYHNLRVHERREDHGMDYPAPWGFSAPYPIAEFTKKFTADKDFSFRLVSRGYAEIRLDGVRHGTKEEIFCPAGKHEARITVADAGGLPCAFIDSEYLQTDAGWTATTGGRLPFPAECEPAFTKEDDDATVFPFAETEIFPITEEAVDGGRLFDFGRESFGSLCLSGLSPAAAVGVFYGESREEALADETRCVVWEKVTGKTAAVLRPRAFRYVHLRGDVSGASVTAVEQLLNAPVRGAFRCDDERAGRIWDTCARTFHLCARECFLDAIKRDRWAWGGDARQSFLISDYLFADPEIVKRTIVSLIPKETPIHHVNTIPDYSMFMLIATAEYYESSGDAEFVKFLWRRLSGLYRYLCEGLDAHGFYVERPGDWIFIDWSDTLDKTGANSSEQILLWKAHEAMAVLAAAAGEDPAPYRGAAAALRREIEAIFWDEERNAYIDSAASGRRQVSRHPAILAILFDLADEERAARLYRGVLQNDGVPAITTPYFKLYELMAVCKCGGLRQAQELLGSYWGKMLDMGATSCWEQFDPDVPAPECYAMYGVAFGKSLCHAWSCGPIYFLGRYCLGVKAAAVGWERFVVEPDPGIYKEISGVVPTPRGDVRVSVKDGRATAETTLTGGVLRWMGKEVPIQGRATIG